MHATLAAVPSADATVTARRSLSAAQSRVVTAAMVLFARHGVAGTSLQMIADELGVTKAAVYHQFQAKEDIVRAATEVELAGVEELIAVAEAKPTPAEAREAALIGIVELAITRRRAVSTFLTDPVIVESFHDDTVFLDVAARLQRVLIADDRGPDASIRTAMLIAAISGPIANPFISQIDDDALREQVTRLARHFLATD